MTEVISVRFKSRGKLYYFDPAGLTVNFGDSVVVETAKGLELGDCARGNHEVPEDKVVPPLRPVVRLATAVDLRATEENKQRELEAFEICNAKIEKHGLDMKLVDVEMSFEGNKTLFFFTSDGRVDFRELVKDLASVFRTRIELRQIGVRDEAKMLGGLGVCGRPFCCSQFLDEFRPVSTKMAKTQSISLNPAKISGTCGRLMCCLRYEQETYEELSKTIPKQGTFVETHDGFGIVTQIDLLRQQVRVRIDGETDQPPQFYAADDVLTVHGGRPKDGELPPRLLPPRAHTPSVAEPALGKLVIPSLFGEEPEPIIETLQPISPAPEPLPQKHLRNTNNRTRQSRPANTHSRSDTRNIQANPRPEPMKTPRPQRKRRKPASNKPPK